MLNQQKYDEQMTDLAHELAQMRRALGRKTTARDNLFSMLEEPGFDRSLFAMQMITVTFSGDVQPEAPENFGLYPGILG